MYFRIYTVFLSSQAKAKKNLTERLKEQIFLQGQDKALLLQWLQNISQNHKKITKDMVDQDLVVILFYKKLYIYSYNNHTLLVMLVVI